jgi:hypothetical protein
MNVAYVSALSALAGSVIGGATSGLTTWMNLRAQAEAARKAHRLQRQEDLVRDFISAATKTYGHAVENNEPDVQDLIALYGMISRMRIRSAPKTVATADKVLDLIISTYFAPNKTVTDLHALIKSGEGVDPLREFAEVAREELGGLYR